MIRRSLRGMWRDFGGAGVMMSGMAPERYLLMFSTGSWKASFFILIDGWFIFSCSEFERFPH